MRKEHFTKVDINKFEFIDSTIYRPKDSILVGIYPNQESESVSIVLLQRSNGGLNVVQTIDALESQFGDTTPVFEDFNQDGLQDLKLKLGSGARGANTFFHLIIQGSAGGLTYIKGAQEIPNISFDTLRRVIVGTYYYRSTSFKDFRLRNDSLIEISGVDVYADSIWTIRESYRLDGNEKVVLKTDSVRDNGEGLFTRWE